ncbi:hypothetical protein D9M72_570060 [compost metagenome]
MAATVMGDNPIAVRQKKKHLRIPVVSAERPAVMKEDNLCVTWTPVLVEDLNAILCCHVCHFCFSCVVRKPSIGDAR